MEKASKVCYEMFQQRLYNNIEHVDDRIMALKNDGKNICVFLTLNLKLNTEITQQYMTIMKNLGVDHGILIYKDSITSSAKKIIDIFNESDIDSKIELFNVEELQYNITKHRLQPKKFEKLSEKEVTAFKKSYGSNYPIMLTSDKVARFFGFEKGSIIKVYYKNGYINYLFVK
jgi:DNA-directed RNA polymerase I, II, and III subunit RPABC1